MAENVYFGMHSEHCSVVVFLFTCSSADSPVFSAHIYWSTNFNVSPPSLHVAFFKTSDYLRAFQMLIGALQQVSCVMNSHANGIPTGMGFLCIMVGSLWYENVLSERFAADPECHMLLQISSSSLTTTTTTTTSSGVYRRYNITVRRRKQLPPSVFNPAHSGRLTVPRTRTNYGDRSFAVQGPRV